MKAWISIHGYPQFSRLQLCATFFFSMSFPCMGWLIFFMDFCYGSNFFYVRISIKENFKYIIILLLLNSITWPFSYFNKFYKKKTRLILCEEGTHVPRRLYKAHILCVSFWRLLKKNSSLQKLTHTKEKITTVLPSLVFEGIYSSHRKVSIPSLCSFLLRYTNKGYSKQIVFVFFEKSNILFVSLIFYFNKLSSFPAHSCAYLLLVFVFAARATGCF